MTTTITISFPPAAVSTPVTVTIEITDSHPVATGFRILGQAFSVQAHTGDGTPVTTFTHPFTLTVHYNDNDVTGFDEDSLKLYYWDYTPGEWKVIPTTVNTDTNTLAAVLDHLTKFAVHGVNACYNFDLDPYIGSGDVQMVASQWHQNGSPYDLDGDGQVTIKDIMRLVAKWGEFCQ